MNTIPVTKRKLDKRTGTEGPHHDPYSYEERIVHVNDVTVKLHLGLMIWCEAYTLSGLAVSRTDERLAVNLFTVITGLTPKAFDKAYDRLIQLH